MNGGKILIAASNDIAGTLKSQIIPASFSVIDSSVSGNDTLRKISLLLPDVVVSDYNLTDMTGFDLAKYIEHLHICPIIILANQVQSEYVEELKKNSLDIFCVTKPINPLVLNHTLSLVLRLSRRIHEFEHQVDDLKHQLEDRKIVEKAKGILMEKFNMTENQAYKEMQKKAMNSSKPLAQIAKTIIDMFKIMEK
jgi:response regulator NasT